MSNLKIYVAGHKGMVGSALVNLLAKQKNVELIIRDRKELDLTNQAAVHDFIKNQKIDQVYLAAAKVGGIYANNTFPAEFIYQNLMIECNVIHQAFEAGVTRLLQLGSSCIYPRAVAARGLAVYLGNLRGACVAYVRVLWMCVWCCDTLSTHWATHA